MINSFWADRPCLTCGRPSLRCRCDAKHFPEVPLTGFEWFCVALFVVAVVAFAVLAS